MVALFAELLTWKGKKRPEDRVKKTHSRDGGQHIIVDGLIAPSKAICCEALVELLWGQGDALHIRAR